MSKNLIAIITGDVVASRSLDPKKWINHLKNGLTKVSQEGNSWQIFRGDMFQWMATPRESMRQAILLKSIMKQASGLDLRMGIGIGEMTFQSENLTESNGEAFVLSGKCFDELGKKRLQILTTWSGFHPHWNLCLDLASLTMDHWPNKTASIIETALTFPQENQAALAKRLGKSQSTISEGLNRGGYYEILDMINAFESDINSKTNY